MTIRNLVAVALACGCHGVNSNPQQQPVDAAEQIDAQDDIDAPVVLAAHGYVIDKQRVPINQPDAVSLGLDLDGDGNGDNQLGAVIATFSTQGLEDTQARTDRMIDRGNAIVLVDLRSNQFAGESTFALKTGGNPLPSPCIDGADTECRRHLAGTGEFDVVASPDTPLEGEFIGGTLATGSGRLHVALSLFSAPATYELLGARVRVTSATATQLAGIIGGALSQTDVQTVLIPRLAETFDTSIAADCPGAPPTCGCPTDSTGEVHRAVFDANQDCNITAQELAANSLIESLFVPDVTIGGTAAVSIGFGFTAKKATYSE